MILSRILPSLEFSFKRFTVKVWTSILGPWQWPSSLLQASLTPHCWVLVHLFSGLHSPLKTLEEYFVLFWWKVYVHGKVRMVAQKVKTNNTKQNLNPGCGDLCMSTRHRQLTTSLRPQQLQKWPPTPHTLSCFPFPYSVLEKIVYGVLQRSNDGWTLGWVPAACQARFQGFFINASKPVDSLTRCAFLASRRHRELK